ncbi:hypothetical protein ACT433_13800 [Acinetobacter baumannii]|nr:hypothetical protein [Acinetobacter baumannii]MDC4947897.1 hypothetical protein [Acinetobacter baumannii]
MSIDNEDQRKSKRQKKIDTFAIVFGLIFMVGFWLKYPQFIEYINREKTPIAVPFKPGAQFDMANDPKKTYMQQIGDNYGTYGDSYGSLNTLFSGLAFAALFISLLLQRRELEAQRKELSAQREEVRESNKIAEEQRKIAKKQRKISNQQAKLLKQQNKEVKIQNFYNIIYPLMNRKARYYELADKLPRHISPRPIDNSIFYHINSNTHHIYHTYCHENRGCINDRDVAIKDIQKKINQKISLVGFYSYLCYSQYIEHFIYIINFIDEFKGINEKDKSTAISAFISDYSNIELYAISLVAISNDILLDLIIKHDLLARIKNIEGYEFDEVFEAIFSEGA